MEAHKWKQELWWKEQEQERETHTQCGNSNSHNVCPALPYSNVTERIKNKVIVIGARCVQCAGAGTITVVIHRQLSRVTFNPNNLLLKGESALVRSEKKKEKDSTTCT